MRFRDIFQAEPSKEIYESINKFVSTKLKQYNDRIKSLGFISKPKDIFDFVWGTVELNAVEVCLIDSPLIQRLRNIQQLGFASYVYCNADYSRFAHTIGVVEASGRIAKAITKTLLLKYQNSSPPSHNGDDIFDMDEVVRISAIFHDAGHMFFSHASERFFTHNRNFPNIDKVTKALEFFNNNISTKASFHEMISVMIVNSHEVKKFFKLTASNLIKSRINSDDGRTTLIEYISGLIVGTAVDKKILPYSRIIKGLIDADRLDYLSRDSAITKVPLAVDIARLISKITVVKLNNYKTPGAWNDHNSPDLPHLSMAIQHSDQRLVWQLTMARSILYQSVYCHHKILTAEAMFRKACEKIFSMIPEKLAPEYLMSLNDQDMGEYFQYKEVPRELHADPRFIDAKEIMIRIRDRNLYKRVASFSMDVKKDLIGKYAWFEAKIFKDSFSEEYLSFINDLMCEYYKVLKSLSIRIPKKPPVFMFIGTDWRIDSMDAIPIDFGNAPCRMSSDVIKETPNYGEENIQKRYYLVTDQQERVLVYIALEKVLLLEHSISIEESASTCAKFTLNVTRRTKTYHFLPITTN